ncbi:hypothetical protein FB107DRAFT_277665 [Schizophyllum commune]
MIYMKYGSPRSQSSTSRDEIPASDLVGCHEPCPRSIRPSCTRRIAIITTLAHPIIVGLGGFYYTFTASTCTRRDYTLSGARWRHLHRFRGARAFKNAWAVDFAHISALPDASPRSSPSAITSPSSSTFTLTYLSMIRVTIPSTASHPDQMTLQWTTISNEGTTMHDKGTTIYDAALPSTARPTPYPVDPGYPADSPSGVRLAPYRAGDAAPLGLSP